MVTPLWGLFLRGICALLAALSMNQSVPAEMVPDVPRLGDARKLSQMEQTEDIRECISLGTQLGLDQIDVDRFDVTVEEIDELYYGMLCTTELPWYMELDWGYLMGEDGTVISLIPAYLDQSEYDRRRYEKAAEEALEQTVFPGMSELQIALSVHDYLAVNCTYDESLERSTEYDVLVHGTAVCQGYAEAYMDLLNRAGVECIIVVSEEMNHCWNQVKIDGQWYNVDVTWDDPTPDRAGMASHGTFLISDETMQTEAFGYSGWESPHTCTDTSYETGWFWSDSVSQITYIDANTCYLNRIGERAYYLVRRDEATGEETRLYRVDFKYPDAVFQGFRRYHYYTAGLTKMGDALYFTDVHQVRRLDLETGEVTAVYEHDVSETRQVLVGSFSDGRTLYLTTMDEEKEIYQMEVPFPR